MQFRKQDGEPTISPNCESNKRLSNFRDTFRRCVVIVISTEFVSSVDFHFMHALSLFLKYTVRLGRHFACFLIPPVQNVLGKQRFLALFLQVFVWICELKSSLCILEDRALKQMFSHYRVAKYKIEAAKVRWLQIMNSVRNCKGLPASQFSLVRYCAWVFVLSHMPVETRVDHPVKLLRVMSHREFITSRSSHGKNSVPPKSTVT